MNFSENRRRFLVSTRGPGIKSRGAGMHQGGTEEAPGRHQGGTEEGSLWHHFAHFGGSLEIFWI